MRRYLWMGTIALALIAAGCSRGRTDTQVASDVQTKINADNTVPDKQLTINATNGVVTLSGTVSSDTARNAAATDAAQVEGVKTVVNNLQVAPPAMAETTEPEAAQPEAAQPEAAQPEPEPRKAARPSPRKSSRRASRPQSGGDNGLRTTVPPTTASNAPADNYNPAPSTPPPAPQPVKVAAGTQISIRLNDEISSETAQIGDVFHGSVSTPITVGGKIVVPTTADVEGRVVDVKAARRFKGQSDLVIELTSLRMHGKRYPLATDRWSKQGKARGKATAAKVGGGAAVGAILGGIFGGGKGAAIGAAAGAGAGTGVSAATKGQQVVLKPEAVLTFQLQNSISVMP